MNEFINYDGMTKDPNKLKAQGPSSDVGPWYYEMQELKEKIT